MRLAISCFALSTALMASCTSAFAQQAWRIEASGATAELRGLSVVSDSVAWASGASRFQAYVTSDGGATWRQLDGKGLDALEHEGAFAASGTCLSVAGARDA